MPILVVKLVGDDVLVCTSGQGYVDIRVFDIDNPYDSITLPLYWNGSSSGSSSSSSTTTSTESSIELLTESSLNQVNYIYAIDMIDIPFTSINVNNRKGEDIVIVAVTNAGISIGYLNLSKWKIEKTEVIGLPSRYHPSQACIEFLSNIQRVIVSLDSDLYLSSLVDNISKKDTIFIDRNKKVNVVTAYGKPLKNLTIDDYLVSNIISLYDHEILLLVKSEHTSIMCARWCKLGINPDQLSVIWEMNLNCEKATAVAINKKAGKQSVIENGVVLANESFIYLCNYTGILCKLSIAEEFGNIISLHIPTHGMIADDRSYGFKVVTSTLSGNYIMYEFDAPHVKNVWQTEIDEPIINNDTISKKVSILKVTGACEPNDSLVLPFIPYCESLIEVDYNYKKDINDDDANISFLLGYNHSYGLQYLKIKYENQNQKLDENLKTRSCDYHSNIDHITGVKNVEILRKGINDLDLPDQYLATCIDDINFQSMMYKCEEGLGLSIDYKYLLDMKDHNHHHSTNLESIPFTIGKEKVTAIIISNRIFGQSSILILNSHGITDMNDNGKLSIIEEEATMFSSLFLDDYILQITKRSLCLLPVKSIGVEGNVLSTFESLNIRSNTQIHHTILSDKYVFLLDKDQQVHIIKFNTINRLFENQGIEKLVNAPAAVSAVGSVHGIQIIAISSWDQQFVDIYKFKEGEPFSLLISMPYPVKDNDSENGFSVFQHIHLFTSRSILNKKYVIELSCFCATIDGQITVYKLYADDEKATIWDHNILKNYNVPGYVKKTKVIRTEDVNSVSLIINSSECDYLLTTENSEQNWKLERIIKKEKFSRSQVVPINSSDGKNNCFAWLETNDDDDDTKETFLCAGKLQRNNKLFTRKGIPIPGIVCELQINEKLSRCLVHWKNNDIRGIAVVDILNLTCLWSHNFNSTDDLYLSNVAIGLCPPVPITKKEAYDTTITMITKSITSTTAQVSAFKFNEDSSGCSIVPIGCLDVDKGIINHRFIGSDLLLIADGDDVSIILWEEEGVLDSNNANLEDKQDSIGARGPVVIAGRLRNRRYNGSNTKKLSHLGNEATLWKDKKVVVGLVTNCICPFPYRDIVEIQYISTCERNENYEIFVSILGHGIEILTLNMSGSSDRYNISRLRNITMNNVILSNLSIKISEKSLNYQRANVLAIERLTGKLVKIEQLLTNDEKKSNSKDGNDNYYTTNLNITDIPKSLTISLLLDISLLSNGYDVIFIDDELNLYRF